MSFKDYIPKINIQFGKSTNKESTAVTVAKQNLNNFANISKLSSSFINSGSPVWRNLSELIYLLDCYEDNPVVQAIINIDADAFGNMRFKVKDLKTGEILPLNQYEKDNGSLSKLLNNPNPLQSTKEWLKQIRVNYKVFGDGYIYGSVPVGFEDTFDYQDIKVLNGLPPYMMSHVLTGKWLDATDKNEIIDRYVLNSFNGYKRDLHPNTVLHLNDINIRFDQNFNKGKSKLLALKMPITNIVKAFESRNVLIMRRGAMGILSSDRNDDAVGTLPLKDEEITDIQEAYKKYGLLEDQYPYFISPVPVKYQQTAMKLKDLMLFEEVESDAIAIATAYNIPELLVKYYIKGGTFENLNASEKRLYDSTIIPESEDFVNALNSFLKLKDYGIELIGSFEHLHILQKNKKEEAETLKIRQEVAENKFMTGLITYGQYAVEIEVDLIDKSLETKYIWDLEEKQLNAIGVKYLKPKYDE
ncbi:phage portal protein [Polaribacter aestuariivivens]|uniref:phage portal protein n=1 Tax=Polaribacter aestuariivivens TaxID=2304626 RepID=UPI003F49785D